MAHSSPKVSIIIPVFNGANYLGAAIQSALSQTYRNIEVIIVDDGSTDSGATEAIARSFGDAVRYLKKKNGGVSSALNYGIQVMEGGYFSWLSHDDVYYPEKIQSQIEYIRKNPDVEILAAGLDIIDNYGNVTSSYTSGDFVFIENGRDVMDNWVYGCSLLIKRTIFDSVGLFNEDNRTVQDLEMWLEVVHKGHKITMMPDILCQWRHHVESDSFRTRKKHLDEVGVFLQAMTKKYPLEFFGQEKTKGGVKNHRREIWGWLGQQALGRGQSEVAGKFYWNALSTDPVFFDSTFFLFLRRFLLSFLLTGLGLENAEMQQKLQGKGFIRKVLRRLTQ